MADILQITFAFFQNPLTWKYFALASIPVLAYSYFFYNKSPRPRPKKLFVVTFFIGCFSVVPLLVYQYFYLNIFPAIESSLLVSNLIARPYLSGLLSYVLHIGFISFLIFIIAFLIALVLTFFSQKTFRNILQSIFEENFNFQFVAFCVGLLILVEVFWGVSFGVTIFQSMLGVIVLRAMMEEYSKHLIVRFIDDDQLFNIDDAIELSLFVGLSFAFVENVLYFSHFSGNLITLFLGRSLLTVLAHIVFSGIFGYYYGLAHFASPLYFEKTIVGGHKFKLIWFLNKFLRIPPTHLFREITVLKGLVIATIIHTIFNLLLEINLAAFAFLLILASAYLLIKLLQLKENYRQLGFIGTEVMPLADFRNLTWKIDSLHWAKEITKERKAKEKQQ